MEITEYLTNSRLKRSEILKTAQTYMHKTTSNDLKNSPVPFETENLYAGPTPNRLKQFESEVGNQLKKFFCPGLNETSQKLKGFVSRSIDENIRKTYSRGKPKLKKRQFVMIPKGNNGCGVKMLNFVPHTKYLSASPEVISERISKSWSKASREVVGVRKSVKENLMLPVLSTAGSHEYRSKVYKY